MFNAQSSCGPTLLLDAAQVGDHRMIEALLSTEPHLDVNARDYDGRTPLSLSAINGHAAVVSLLLSHGANPNWQDFSHAVPLWYAACGGHAGVVRALLESGQLSDLNPMHQGDEEEKPETPLSIALDKGYRDVVDLLIREDSIDPFVQVQLDDGYKGRGIYGRTSVIGLAIRNGYEDVALALLKTVGSICNAGAHGAIIGSELLVLAASVGSTRLVATLLGEPHTVDPNTAFPYHNDFKLKGLTPLSVAIKHGHGSIAQLLMGTKCLTPKTLNDSLFLAETRDMVQILLEDEFLEPDWKNSEGRTPLSMAAGNGSVELVEEFLLIKDKVDPNSRDDQGRTPLIWAVSPPSRSDSQRRRKKLSVAQPLLACGRVDPNIADNDGTTALYWAVKHGDTSIVKLILECSKTDPYAECCDGSTPLAVAASARYRLIFEMILRTCRIDIHAMISHNHGKYTVLSLAAIADSLEKESAVTRLLSEPGIDPNKTNEDGTTPLTLAAKEGSWSAVNFLLTAGKVLIVQEQHPPAADEHTYWERVGLLTLSDGSLESKMLERRTLMLM